MTDLTIAQEIANQLGSQAFAMMGTTKKLGDTNSLTINFKGCRKYNHVKIVLNSMDTYDLTFMKVSLKTGITSKDEVNNIYNDQLKEIIEKHTGLYLSL